MYQCIDVFIETDSSCLSLLLKRQVRLQQTFFCHNVVILGEKGFIFCVNCLHADNSHKISSLIWLLKEAVEFENSHLVQDVAGPLRVLSM